MLRPLFFLSAASNVSSSAASMRVAMSANLKAMAWKLEMAFSKLFTFLGVFHTGFECAFGDAEGEGCDGDSTTV